MSDMTHFKVVYA